MTWILAFSTTEYFEKRFEDCFFYATPSAISRRPENQDRALEGPDLREMGISAKDGTPHWLALQYSRVKHTGGRELQANKGYRSQHLAPHSRDNFRRPLNCAPEPDPNCPGKRNVHRAPKAEGNEMELNPERTKRVRSLYVFFEDMYIWLAT